MKKLIKNSVLAIVIATTFTITAKAQESTPDAGNVKTSTISGIRLSIGTEAGLPVGSFRDNYNWSIGGSIQADFPIVSDQLFITTNAGYMNYFAKNNNSDMQLLPVKAGLKYFPVAGLFIQGEAGASFLTNKSDVQATKSASFVYAPQIGYQFKLSGHDFLETGARWEGNSKFTDNGNSSNLLSLRVAYGFGL